MEYEYEKDISTSTICCAHMTIITIDYGSRIIDSTRVYAESHPHAPLYHNHAGGSCQKFVGGTLGMA